MEMPTPCQHCGELFDLLDGYGSDKWYRNTTICEQCYRLEEKEIEEDDEIENQTNRLSDAEFDRKDARKYLIEKKALKQPKIVCYCGSLRVAMEAFKKAEYESVMKGEIALLPCCMFVDIEREFGAESNYKLKADELHKRKIDLCDEVFVLNVNGYIGSSTKSEIEYAIGIGKPIIYLEPLN